MFTNIDNITYIGFLLTIGASIWSLAWWLNGHFTNIRKDVYLLGKEITQKLEYHERHDDARFNQIRDDIWEIRLRNAALEALPTNTPPVRIKKEIE